MRLNSNNLGYLGLIIIVLLVGCGSFSPATIPLNEIEPISPNETLDTCTNCYYVNGARGSDANAGKTPNNPWKTIQKAADTMLAGDRTIVLPGVYNERVQITQSGTPGGLITFEAEGTVIIQGFTIHADYISIIGFEITNTPDEWEDGYGIWVDGSNCDLERNYIHFATRGGIRLFSKLGNENGTSHCTVRNNRLYRNALAGIEVFGRNHLIENNEIWGTIQYHPKSTVFSWADADGIRFFGSGHIIRGNYIHDITYQDPENIDPHIDCFQTWSGTDREVGHNVVFESNRCEALEAFGKHRFGTGFMLEGGSSHITIRNNIIRAYKVINAINSPYLTVVNNVLTSDLSLPTTYYPAIIYLSGSPNVVIQNNIFFDPISRVVYIGDNQSNRGLVAGYNCTFRSDGSLPKGSPNPHDLWNVNPLFVDPEAGNFQILPDSPVIDRGINLKSINPVDFFGNSRPKGSGYDIGIYEYNPIINLVNWLPLIIAR